MEIVTIFDNCLYAVKYDGETSDELERLFDEWSDVTILYEFFTSNKKDLTYYQLNIKSAIEETLKEAKEFRKRFIRLSNKKNPNLDSIFKNLDDLDVRVYELVKRKSKRKWLRIYAIRIDTNVYLITGGAIKLTHKMEERPHTALELTKLEKCRNYLIENGVFDIDSYREMLNE